MRFALAFLLVPLLALYPRPFVDDRPTAEILGEVLRDKDGCDVRTLFEELGTRGDREAFEAIAEGLPVLEELSNQVAGYRALRHFVGAEPKLERRVITWLDKGLRRPRETPVYLAAMGLAYFGGAAEKELRYHLGRQQDRAIRAALVEGLLGVLEEEGSAQALELILANHRPAVGGRGDLQRILGKLYDSSRKRLTVRELTDRDRVDLFRTAFVEAFGGVPGGAVDELLGDLLLCDEEAIAVAASDALAPRPGEAVEAQLDRGLTRGLGAAVRGGALRGLLARPATGERATVELERLAVSRKDADREAAAHALGGVGGPTALLLALLEDEVESVRAAALSGALSRRDKAVVPALIEGLETDVALRSETHRVLTLLTGKDFGDRPQRWRTFWKAEGADFELPGRTQARREVQGRVAEAQKRDRDSFYGLRIEGEGIYLLLDGSDSMKGLYSLGTKAGEENVTLLDVLGEEVAGALGRMEEGQRLNLVFFGTTLESFAPKMVRLDAETRGRAVEFARRTETLGATGLHRALETAFADPKMDTIYLVTDGNPGKSSETERLLTAVRKWNRRRDVVIHGVDIGSLGVLAELSVVSQLAELTGGSFKHAPPAILAGR